MSFAKRFSLAAGPLALSLCFAAQACALDAQSGKQAPSPTPAPSSSPSPLGGGGSNLPAGWQRFWLDGGAGDRIGVFLPEKPKEFPGGKFKVSPGLELPAKVFLVSRDARTYLAIFVDLPQDVGELKADEREAIFSGTWRGVVEMVGRALEEKFGGPLEVTPSGQQVGEIKGGERRMQDFKLGGQNGRAQAMFLGRRVYMLISVRVPNPEAEEDARRFLESFQVYPGKK